MAAIKNIFVLADLETLDKESEKTKAFLNENCQHIEDFKTFDRNTLTENDHVFLYLSDDEIKKLLPELAATNCAIGFLPHPEALQIRSGYQVPKDTKEAFEELFETDRVV